MLRRIDGAFLIRSAFHPQATQFGLNLIDAAVKAGVSKIVYNGVYHPSLSLVNDASTRPVEEALYSWTSTPRCCSRRCTCRQSTRPTGRPCRPAPS